MTIKTKAAPGNKTGAAQENSSTSQNSGNSSAAQRARLLARLRQAPVFSTIEARHALDIMHPGGRVMELRRQGVNVVTYWRREESAGGKAHRVALYVLIGEAGGES